MFSVMVMGGGHVCIGAYACVWRPEDNLVEYQLSPSMLAWVLGIKLRFPGLLSKGIYLMSRSADLHYM